jgi:hypothetical protein
LSQETETRNRLSGEKSTENLKTVPMCPLQIGPQHTPVFVQCPISHEGHLIRRLLRNSERTHTFRCVFEPCSKIHTRSEITPISAICNIKHNPIKYKGLGDMYRLISGLDTTDQSGLNSRDLSTLSTGVGCGGKKGRSNRLRNRKRQREIVEV